MGFRDVIPPSLQEIVQNGLLDNVFEQPLLPILLYERLAEIRPWGANLGSESIMTRAGLMGTTTTPITGADASAGAYGFEQYTMKMDQWGKSIDTNMAVSAQALASKFLEDNQILGVNAGQVMNLLARNALYNAYGVARTWLVTAAATGATTVKVHTALGFVNSVADLGTTTTKESEGLKADAVPTLVAVSGTNYIPTTIGGHAVHVTGVDLSTNVLTLSTGLTAAVASGAAVVATSYGSPSYRPNARASANQLVAGDVATLTLFMSAATRLRSMNVPTVGGAYQAHISPETLEELFQTAAFQKVYTGRADSPAWHEFTMGATAGDVASFLGRFVGIDWWLNNLTPTVTVPSGVKVYRPIVCGAGSLIKGPFERMADLVSNMNAGSTVEITEINGIVRILRAPLDRLGQVLSSTWSWIGGYSVGTDMLTGDTAVYKRAVVLEHV